MIWRGEGQVAVMSAAAGGGPEELVCFFKLLAVNAVLGAVGWSVWKVAHAIGERRQRRLVQKWPKASPRRPVSPAPANLPPRRLAPTVRDLKAEEWEPALRRDGAGLEHEGMLVTVGAAGEREETGVR